VTAGSRLLSSRSLVVGHLVPLLEAAPGVAVDDAGQREQCQAEVDDALRRHTQSRAASGLEVRSTWPSWRDRMPNARSEVRSMIS
jgi:hypothetical protein